jgi:hypothetical protein
MATEKLTVSYLRKSTLKFCFVSCMSRCTTVTVISTVANSNQWAWHTAQCMSHGGSSTHILAFQFSQGKIYLFLEQHQILIIMKLFEFQKHFLRNKIPSIKICSSRNNTNILQKKMWSPFMDFLAKDSLLKSDDSWHCKRDLVNQWNMPVTLTERGIRRGIIFQPRFLEPILLMSMVDSPLHPFTHCWI